MPLVAVLATGCGAAPSTKSAASPPKTPTSPDNAQTTTDPDESGDEASADHGSLMFFSHADGSAPKAPHEVYRVFRRASLASDVRVGKRARADALLDLGPAHTGARASLGSPVYGDTRLVLGTTDDGVYALPTTSDGVCVSAFPDGGGGCTGTVSGLHGLTVDYDGSSHGLRIYGLVGDDVVGVDVVVDGVTRHAEFGENGYRLELADRRWQQVRSFVLKLRDGTTDAIPLPPLR
jgi:hypothetical protein